MINYEIKEQIGKGLYSKIYKVQVDATNYAMKKVCLNNITRNQKKYLLSELKILSEHTSPFLIKYYDSFVKEESINYIMEYCKKGTLQNIIKYDKLSNEYIYKYLAQICFGVKYLHDQKIIHRDLKSSNILIDQHNNVKIIDFGVSKILNDYMTYTKSFVGTPYNMSPELFKHSFYDNKIDIWAIGIILYEMTHRKMPFECKTLLKLQEKITIGKYQMNEFILTEFKNIITKCLQVAPYRRLRLNDVLKLSNIRKYKPKQTEVFQKIKQIDNIPNITNEWKNILNNIPNKIPQTKSENKSKQIRKWNCDFMKNYSKDNLVHLNSKLIDIICEKDKQIKELKDELQKRK